MEETMEVELDLETRGLGCNIIGGTDAGERGIYISSVLPDGAAEAAGLQSGDELLTIGEVQYRELSHAEAVQQLIKLTGKVTALVVRYSSDAHTDFPVAESGAQAEDSIALSPMPERTEVLVPKRRSTLARHAYSANDAARSRVVHTLAPEKHQSESGQYLKAAVFGGLDGIITTFAVVASVAGADLATGLVIVMGFANLLGDGVSMGFGEFLSLQAEHAYISHERAREQWEFENFPEGEIGEMVDIYKKKGFSTEDANMILNLMVKQREFFIDHMMVQELGLMPPDESESPVKNGIVMFCSFMIFGIIPLLAYVVLGTVSWGDGFDPLFLIACILTGISLFVLGVLRARFSPTTWWASGLWVLANGAVAAGVAYLVGYITSLIVDVNEC